MSERLTNGRYTPLYQFCKDCPREVDCDVRGCRVLRECLDKLAAYEDKEEMGCKWITPEAQEQIAELSKVNAEKRLVILPKPLTTTDLDTIRDIGRIVNNLDDMENQLIRAAESEGK